jgi:hypothetical protein
MASAAMIHFGLDPGKFVRFLLGKYTGQYWVVHHTLDAIRDHVTSDNMIISNKYCSMVALLNLPLRNHQATS